MLIASLFCLLSGCSAFGKVAVVDIPPQQCKLLEELSFHRACDHDGKVIPEDLTEFKRLARKIGADTIQCCRVSDYEELLFSTNSRTGQICTGVRQRFASAYLCGTGKQ